MIQSRLNTKAHFYIISKAVVLAVLEDNDQRALAFRHNVRTDVHRNYLRLLHDVRDDGAPQAAVPGSAEADERLDGA